MTKRKYLLVFILTILTLLFCKQSVFAEEYETAKVLTLDSLNDFDDNAILSCEQEFDFTDYKGEEKTLSKIYRVEIEKDSIVRFDVAGTDYSLLIDGTFAIYSNEVLSNKIASSRVIDINGSHGEYKTETCYLHLTKGTYYLQFVERHYSIYDGSKQVASMRASIAAVPVEKVFGVNVKKNKLVLTNNFTGNRSVFLVDGTYNINSLSNAKSERLTENVNKVRSSGYYTVVYCLQDNTIDDTLFNIKPTKYNSVVFTELVDVDKPVILGVKNNGVYKKVTIKFSDKHSGIKFSTLNGKKIKSGTKVSKNGSYTLLVTDKAGNSRRVKFKIRK